MAGDEEEWLGALGRLAEEALRKARREAELGHYERVRRIKSPTGKLVYLFMKDHQPQSVSSIRRTLGVGRNSVPRALEELVTLGYLVRDEEFLYWVTPLEAGKAGVSLTL